jgi:hypothetical protein
MAAGHGTARNGRRRGRGDTLVSTIAEFTQLDCNCIRHGGEVGEEFYCARHRRVATVTQAAPEYVVTCVDCRRTKRHGLARVTAEVDARRHARRCQHRAQLWHGAKLVDEVGPRAPGQMALFNKDSTQGA